MKIYLCSASVQRNINICAHQQSTEGIGISPWNTIWIMHGQWPADRTSVNVRFFCLDFPHFVAAEQSGMFMHSPECSRYSNHYLWWPICDLLVCDWLVGWYGQSTVRYFACTCLSVDELVLKSPHGVFTIVCGFGFSRLNIYFMMLETWIVGQSRLSCSIAI